MLRALAGFVAILALWWFVIRPLSNLNESRQDWRVVESGFGICAKPKRGERKQGCVVDGDTVVIGYGPERRRIRLTGYDAPELEGACENETALALEARNRLHQWLEQGSAEWSGGDDPPRDQYGRELRQVRRVLGDGSFQSLAEVMIAEGLAVQNGWGSTEAGWCN